MATEAGMAVLDFAFGRLAFDEVIALIHPENTRSQRVAQKLGMDIEQQVKNPVLARPVDVWQLDNTNTTGHPEDDPVLGPLPTLCLDSAPDEL